MILPANEVYISGIALKATTVTEDGEKLILTCIKPELWEVVSKIDLSEAVQHLSEELLTRMNTELQHRLI